MIKFLRSWFQVVLLLGVVPVYVGAVGRYGQKTLYLLGMSLLTGCMVDVAGAWLRGTQRHRSAWLSTWLLWILFPLALPVGVPLWVVPLGLGFALATQVHLFGGYGRNLLPVVAGAVVFLTISYPGFMGRTYKPFAVWDMGFSHYSSRIPLARPVLDDLRRFDDVPVSEFVRGAAAGDLGASYPVYLVCLAMLLMLVGILDWRFVTSAVFAVAAFAVVGHAFFPAQILAPVRQFLGGSLIFYLAVLLPADPFCLPRTPPGRVIAGFLFAFFVVLVRAFSAYSGGVYFAAMLTSVFTPIVDFTCARRFYRQPRIVSVLNEVVQ